MKARRKQRGVTLVESVTAATITVMVLSVGISGFLTGMQSWLTGQVHIDAEVRGQQSLRSLTQELREAMSVTISSDGKTIDYRLPSRNESGDYVTPAVWDGITRHVYVSEIEGELHGNSERRYRLRIGYEGHYRTLTDNIILHDPDATGRPSYKPFQPGSGSIMRQFNVLLVMLPTTTNNETIHNRVRETVFLRNVPSVTQ